MRTPLAATPICLLAFLIGCGGGASSPPSSKPAHPDSPGGAERSVEAFGAEAGGGEREAVLSAFHEYLTAIARRDYARACARLSNRTSTALERLAPGPRRAGCEAVLPGLLAASAATVAAEQDEARVVRVRLEGSEALVLYRAPGAHLYVFGLVREGSGWKATAVSGSILVPDLPGSAG
jgi:hypothetical protein